MALLLSNTSRFICQAPLSFADYVIRTQNSKMTTNSTLLTRYLVDTTVFSSIMPEAKRSGKGSRNRYASLQPRVKTLKESTIRKKWKKLPVVTQAKVAGLLRTVERPALTNGGNDKKNNEVQAVVSEMVEEYVTRYSSGMRNTSCWLTSTPRLVQRLPRMPFPPGTDELSFDFESTINHQVIKRFARISFPI